MAEVVMPRLSDSMEEGTIVRWLKQDGENVTQGEPLAEVETDKATVTFDADADGTLRILVGEGETVPIGKPIAEIGDAATPEREANGRAKASPLARRLARESGVDLSLLTGSGPGGRIIKSDVTAAAQPASPTAPKPPLTAEPPSRPAGNKGAVTVQQPRCRSRSACRSREPRSRPSR
jgi:pyruvate dehydrogenase E2 component (dihydrolipoamide acetyltransferase)